MGESSVKVEEMKQDDAEPDLEAINKESEQIHKDMLKEIQVIEQHGLKEQRMIPAKAPDKDARTAKLQEQIKKRKEDCQAEARRKIQEKLDFWHEKAGRKA